MLVDHAGCFVEFFAERVEEHLDEVALAHKQESFDGVQVVSELEFVEQHAH